MCYNGPAMKERNVPSERPSRGTPRPQRRVTRRGIKWQRLAFTIIAIIIILFMILSTFAPVAAPP